MNDPREAISRLLEIMATLRSEQGCPWDREQSPESLKPYLIEETFEVLEAIEEGDASAICEELGDLLLQVVFQAQIFAERGEFDFADVAGAISSKLIRRHPHVFAGDSHGGNDLHQLRWEEIKRAEKRSSGRQHTILGGVPRALPSLQRASKVIDKGTKAGLVWPTPEKLARFVAKDALRLQEALSSEAAGTMDEVLGDLLFVLVVQARVTGGLDAENALQAAIDRFQASLECEEKLLTENQRLNATDFVKRWRNPGTPEQEKSLNDQGDCSLVHKKR